MGLDRASEMEMLDRISRQVRGEDISELKQKKAKDSNF